MPDTRDPRSVIEAAEQAASAGDYASAEALLREAADLQEASLGPLHPELANTLNNLGVVCEIIGKPDDAERCFRRACEIAAVALEPGHPFIATSRTNLADFCAARGKAVDAPVPPPPSVGVGVDVEQPQPPPAVNREADVRPPPPPPAVDRVADVRPQPSPAVARDVDVRQPPPPRTVDRKIEVRQAQPVPVQPARSTPEIPPRSVEKPASRPLPMFGLIAGGLVVIALATTMLLRPTSNPQPTLEESAAAPAESPATPTAVKPIPPKPVEPRPAPPAPVDVPKTTAPTKTEQAAAKRPAPTSVPASAPIVVDVQLCKDGRTGGPIAGGWRCDPASSPVAPGRLLFYTRLKSPAATTVEHRWYRGDRLRQSVDLAIRPNPGSGYRTYSRNTVWEPGDWRVELRTRDGALLHQERFTVR
jgi:hypothetical protein